MNRLSVLREALHGEEWGEEQGEGGGGKGREGMAREGREGREGEGREREGRKPCECESLAPFYYKSNDP